MSHLHLNELYPFLQPPGMWPDHVMPHGGRPRQSTVSVFCIKRVHIYWAGKGAAVEEEEGRAQAMRCVSDVRPNLCCCGFLI